MDVFSRDIGTEIPMLFIRCRLDLSKQGRRHLHQIGIVARLHSDSLRGWSNAVKQPPFDHIATMFIS